MRCENNRIRDEKTIAYAMRNKPDWEICMNDLYDDKVIDCFLKGQLQLFPESVADTPEEAEAFLEDCMAVVVNSPKKVIEYFDEVGADIQGLNEKTILDEAEVFDVGDGRYLIVEG